MVTEVVGELNGFVAHVAYDESPESPREWDNLGIILGIDSCTDSSYLYNLLCIGENSKGEPLATVDQNGFVHSKFDYFLRNEFFQGERILIVEAYIDSRELHLMRGNTLVISTESAIRAAYLVPEGEPIKKSVWAKARECLEAEVKTYNQYLEGDVYGYMIKTEDCDEVDSCWGFYGFEEVKEQALSSLEYYSSRVEDALAETSAA